MNAATPWTLSTTAYGAPPGRRDDVEHDRFAPIFTIHETGEAYEIEGDLACSARRDVTVKPHRHSVEIRCGRAIDHEPPEDESRHAPRFGSFTTQIALTHPIDVRHAGVSFRGGVLRILVPKADRH